MRRFIWATLYVTVGVAAGCISAFALIQQAGVKSVAAGEPWQSRAAAMAGPDAFYVRSHYLLEGRLPLAGRILLVSGRVSFELMQKALAAGAGCVAAISAPTTAAVEFAAQSGQTLVGFLRPAGGPGSPMRMNVYAGTVAG